MTFPGPYARIYRNEAGEVLGWDNEASFEPEYDPDAYLASWDDDDDE